MLALLKSLASPPAEPSFLLALADEGLMKLLFLKFTPLAAAVL